MPGAKGADRGQGAQGAGPEAGTAVAGESVRALRRLGREWWQLRSRILRAWFATLVAVLATLAQPWPLKLLIDDVLPATDASLATAIAGTTLLPAAFGQALAVHLGRTEVALLLAAAIGLATWVAAAAGAREKLANAGIREAFGVHLRDVLLGHILRLGHATLTHARRGELVLRLVDDVGRVNRLYNKTLPQLLRHALATTGLLAILAAIDWRIGAIATTLTLTLALVARAHAQGLQRAAFAKRHREGDVAGLAQEIVGAVEQVQINAAEARVRARFRQENTHSFAAGIAETLSGVLLERRLQVLGGCAVAAIAGAGALLVQSGALTLGTLTVCIAYMTQLLKPVEKLNELAADITQGTARATRLLQLLEAPPGIDDGGTLQPARGTPLTLTLEGVGFTWPGRADEPPRPVFAGLDLTLRQGEIVAITGANGSGKSTLVRLLLRVLEPAQGRLLLDGRAYADYALQALRQCFAVSTQAHQSFGGSVRDLLRGIDAGATDAAMWQALREVRMDAHVQQLPGALDAVLGENAANLSGGQRARLALAAALLAGRPVLVLDEPFANIDDASRHVILATLEQTRADRLCIAITHERSLLAIADRALRLEDGGLTAITASAHADATATTHPVMEVLHARA